MIYSVRADQADYEQYYEVIVVAETETEAITIAKETFDLAKNWYSPWEEQSLTVNEIDLDSKGVIAALIA